MPDESNPMKEAAAKAAVDLAKQAYEDGAQSLVRNIGQLVALPFRLLNAGLANVRAVLTDHEAQHAAIERGMAERWAKIPPNRLLPPPTNVAGPWLLGYAFVQDEQDAPLRELYEELLASAMDADKQPLVHPSFVEMLRQMTPLEARFIRFLAEQPFWRVALARVEATKAVSVPISEHVSKLATRVIQLGFGHALPDEFDDELGEILDNLERLKLVRTDFESSIPEVDYEALSAKIMNAHKLDKGQMFSTAEGAVAATQLGRRFIRACISQAPLPQSDEREEVS